MFLTVFYHFNLRIYCKKISENTLPSTDLKKIRRGLFNIYSWKDYCYAMKPSGYNDLLTPKSAIKNFDVQPPR